MPDTVEPTPVRDAILRAGLTEFSRHGLQGARLERIAAASGYAKRMIYYYFTNKDGLYLAVLERAYSDIRASEHRLDLGGPAIEALIRLAHASFDYHEANAAFTRLVLMENLQGGAALAGLADVPRLRAIAFAPLTAIIARGERDGSLRPGLTAVDLHFLISSFCSFRADHAATWKGVLDVALLEEPERTRQRDLLTAMLRRYAGA